MITHTSTQASVLIWQFVCRENFGSLLEGQCWCKTLHSLHTTPLQVFYRIICSQHAPWNGYLATFFAVKLVCVIPHMHVPLARSCDRPHKLTAVCAKSTAGATNSPRMEKWLQTQRHYQAAPSNDLQSWDLKFAPCMAPVRVSCLQRCSARLWRLNKSICWSPVVCVCVCFCGAPRQECTGGGGLKILTATGSSEARSLSLSSSAAG